jgi:FkbM family methyltransferase
MTFYHLLNQIIPPFCYRWLHRIGLATGLVKEEKPYVYAPDWHPVTGGLLKGRKIFIDPHDNLWQTEMLEGIFDNFYFEYLKRFNLSGKAIYDVGAHIGYHTLSFATIVGSSGFIAGFEPNTYNQKRIELLLSKNKDLADRISIYAVALSNKKGGTEFSFSADIDNGLSSGGFISGAHTPTAPETYQTSGFTKISIPTVRLDDAKRDLGISRPPDLMKIDVEGAEHLVLEGAKDTIIAAHPILLIEIHSIYNMYHAISFLREIGYQIKLLDVANKGLHCSIVAIHPDSDYYKYFLHSV